MNLLLTWTFAHFLFWFQNNTFYRSFVSLYCPISQGYKGMLWNQSTNCPVHPQNLPSLIFRSIHTSLFQWIDNFRGTWCRVKNTHTRLLFKCLPRSNFHNNRFDDYLQRGTGKGDIIPMEVVRLGIVPINLQYRKLKRAVTTI